MYATLLVGVFLVVAVSLLMLTGNGDNSNSNKLVDLDDTPNLVAKQNPSVLDEKHADNSQTKPSNIPVTKIPEKESTNVAIAQVTPVITVVPDKIIPPDTTKVTGDKTGNTKPGTQKAETVNTETKPVMQTTTENLTFEKADGIMWPLKGNVILRYSMDSTVYYATLKQSMTNPGIVIAGTLGAEVKASAKGIVTNIEEHARTGFTVTTDIGNDFRLVYGQLEKSGIKIGDVVEAGAVIGTLAKVSRFYVIEGENLFFQVLEGDTTLDPMTLIKAD